MCVPWELVPEGIWLNRVSRKVSLRKQRLRREHRRSVLGGVRVPGSGEEGTLACKNRWEGNVPAPETDLRPSWVWPALLKSQTARKFYEQSCGFWKKIFAFGFLTSCNVTWNVLGKVNMYPLALKLLTLAPLIFFQFWDELLKPWWNVAQPLDVPLAVYRIPS